MNITEMLRFVKFGAIRPAQCLSRSGHLAVFAHLMGLRAWLDRARIDLVIDVGGNTGQFASALRYIGYRGDIISFEPIPDAYAALAERMKKDKHWQGRPLGIADFVGQGILNIMAETVLSSFRRRSTQAADTADEISERLAVSVRTLESIIDEMSLVSRLPHTLVKSDTQGYEMEVLRGLGRYIKQVKLILCEISSIQTYDNAPFMTELIDFLHEQGFHAVSFSPVNGDSVRPVEFDYLCVNEATAP
jgi:FkbM family methyltransferase